MKAAGIVDFGTDLQNPNFANLRHRGSSWTPSRNARTGSPDDHEALRHDGPALVEVLVNRQELSMGPTIREAGEAASASLCSSRAQRTRRRNVRSREDESFPVARAKQSHGFSTEEYLGIYSRLIREVGRFCSEIKRGLVRRGSNSGSTFRNTRPFERSYTPSPANSSPRRFFPIQITTAM